MRAGRQHNFLAIAIGEYEVFNGQLLKLAELTKAGFEIIEFEHDDEKYSQNIYYMQDEIFETEDLLEKTCIKIIIFLATYLESYIWDFAATRLGESYVEKHLDKLKTISKWEIIPLLVTGKRLEIKGHQLEVFRALIIERNRLIHHKSIEIAQYMGKQPIDRKLPKELINTWERLEISKFFNFIKYVLIEFDKIDPQGTHIYGVKSLP